MRWLITAVCVLTLVACGERRDAGSGGNPPPPPPPAIEAPALDYASSEALVIVQQNYSRVGEGWNQLDGAADDGAMVAEALRAQGFSVEIANDLTLQQMRDRISAFLSRQRESNPLSPASFTRAIVYFAGHGANNRATGRTMGYLVPIDAPLANRDDFHLRALPLDWLRDQAAGSTARHTMLVLDSCFSSSIFGSRGAVRPRDPSELEQLRQRGVFVLTASDIETPDRGHFTEAFVRAIRGAADFDFGRGRDGLVTATEIGPYIREEINAARQTNRNAIFGTPGFSTIGLSPGDMMFGPPAALRVSSIVSEEVADLRRDMAELFSRPLREGETPILSPCSGFETPAAVQDGRVPVTICYFRKDADGTRVSDALAAARIPFDMPPARLTSLINGEAPSTNMIACGADVPGASIRQLALTLHDAGITIRAVGALVQGAAQRRNELQVLTSAARASRPPLTRAQLEAITNCPTMLQN